MKRTLTIILTLVLLLLLASCGTTSRGGGEIALGDDDGAATAYSARTLSTDSELGILSSVCGADGGAYAAFDSGVYFVSYDGTLEALDLSLPDGAAVSAMCTGDDGLWLTVRRTVGDSFAYELWRVSDGEAPEVFELAVRDKLVPHSMCRSGDRLYIGMSDYINTFVLSVYDLGGKPEYELDIGSDFTVTGDGGRVYVGHRSRAEGKLTLSEAVSRKLNTLASFSGGRLLSCVGDRVYLSDTTGAFEYGVGTGEVSRLFQWESVGVSSAGAKLCSDGEGNFIVFGSQGIKLVTPSGEARRQIVLALNSPPGMYSTAVLDFNSASEEYELVIRDYSGYQDPQQMLAVDIASGQCPDLIDLMSFPADILGANAMTDLTEYLKADPGISEGDLLHGVLSAMKTGDGRLPAIAPLFYVNSFFTVADGSESAPFTGVSDGLARLGEAEYTFAGSLGREDFLALAFGCGELDYSAGEIAAILEYAAALPEEASPAPGGQRIHMETFGSARSLFYLAGTLTGSYSGESMERLAVVENVLREGTGTVVPLTYLCVPANAPSADGAWEFIKSLLLREDTFENCFPLLRANYDLAREYEEDWIRKGTWFTYTNGGKEEKHVFTMVDCEAEYALAERILGGVGSVLYPNSTALSIVRECSAAFFAGDTTADECAEDIRSRLDIYTWERG